MAQALKERYLTIKRKLFDKAYSQKLNAMQRQAVFATEGPVLILAGAGSGKTTVLVNRIVHIIKYGDGYSTDFVPPELNEGRVAALERALALSPEEIERDILPEFIHSPCPPWAMLAITFTNKAAREIRERLSGAFEDERFSDDIWAGTFHSVCLKILHRFVKEAGYQPGFTIYDTDDKRMLLTTIMKELQIDEKKIPVKAIAAEISRAKDELEGPEDMFVGADKRKADIQKVYETYQKRLKSYNAMDFDDIIMVTVRLLQNCAEARELCQKRFRYVSVDEYQDTNVAQFRLTELLSSGKRNIMVVGDDDQSIYRFRGATVENILSFDKVYKDCTVVKLEQNYRSTKTILEAANGVIAKNEKRHSKTLWCASVQGDPISLITCANQIDEAKYITDTIMKLVVREKRRYRDFAVLYRINEMARSLETGFAKSGIPYRVLGTQRFYDRKEIKDMLSYLFVIANPSDTGRLRRIVNEPKRKLGAASIEAATLIGEAVGLSLFEVMSHADEYPALGRSAQGMIGFTELIRSFDKENTAPSKLLEEVFFRTGYRKMLEDNGEVDKVRIQSVEELISAAVEYEKRTEEPTLLGFLEETELVSDVDKYDEDADAVVLMTIHSAKGLEFPMVFLPGMEEGIFPGTQSFTDPGELSEERRLAYVALTRAKEKIYISHASERMLYGRTTNNRVSRFVNEIPEELIREEEERVASYAPPQSYYSRSFGFREQPKAPSRPMKKGKPAVSERAYVSPMMGQSVLQKKVETERFGISRFPVGTEVVHAVFGAGTIISAKDMGGDVLYEIAFENGSTKKLMATFAKLEKKK